MISKKMEKALNDQLNYELYSAYIYAAMGANFEHDNLLGCANWMKVQTQEEVLHATKFYTYIIAAGGRVELDAIGKPKTIWKSPLEAFEEGLKHEQSVTARINKLADLAVKESDHASAAFLQWFVTEQVEEEANATSIIQKLKLVGKDTSGLFMIDQQLAARVFTPPPAAA